jgi:hypothetical protein
VIRPAQLFFETPPQCRHCGGVIHRTADFQQGAAV